MLLGGDFAATQTKPALQLLARSEVGKRVSARLTEQED